MFYLTKTLEIEIHQKSAHFFSHQNQFVDLSLMKFYLLCNLCFFE
jgi:hypothetical protein